MLHVLLADGQAPVFTWTTLVNLVVAVVAPLVVALINRAPDTRLKAIELAVIAAVTGILNEWLVSAGPFNWGQALVNALTTLVLSVAAVYGLYEPTGVSDKARSSGRT